MGIIVDGTDYEDAVAFRLTEEQIKNIIKDGFCYVEFSPGSFIRATMNDLMVDSNDLMAIKERL